MFRSTKDLVYPTSNPHDWMEGNNSDVQKLIDKLSLDLFENLSKVVPLMNATLKTNGRVSVRI